MERKTHKENIGHVSGAVHKGKIKGKGKGIWIRISSQIDEWDDGRNPQFIVFVNGEVYQGIWEAWDRQC